MFPAHPPVAGSSEFCMLILYPVTFLKVSARYFLVESGFSKYEILSAHKDNSISSFPIFISVVLSPEDEKLFNGSH